jgi:hypothetical protein
MAHSEQYVHKLIQDRYGISLKKIDDSSGKYGQEPDFEYIMNNERIFVCELKEYEAINPSEEAGWEIKHHSDGSAEATRNSNAPNKISESIHNAYKQLIKYSEPKILIYLNHYPGLDVRDLEETYRGFGEYVVGDRKIIDYYYRRASKGKIREEKTKIDLYIWIDASDKNSAIERDEIYLRSITAIGNNIAEKYFRVTDNK